MKKRFFKKKNVFIVACVLIVLVVFITSHMKPVPVDIEIVDQDVVIKKLEENGHILSRNTTTVMAQIGGTVEHFHKEVGEKVKKGDLLLSVNAENIDAAISLARSRRDSAVYSFENALSGGGKRKKAQLFAVYQSSLISRNQAKSLYEKSVVLYDKGAISKQKLEDSQVTLQLAQQNLNKNYESWKKAKEGLTEALKGKFESDIKAYNTELERLKKEKEKYKVYAFEEGTILKRFVENKAVIATGTPLYEIGDLSNIYCKSQILDSDIGKIFLGMPVWISGINDKKVKAKVTKIFPIAENFLSELGIEQKRITVEIEPLEDIGSLFIGQNVDLHYIIQKTDETVRVLESLTYQEKGVYHVFVNEKGKAQVRKLEVGLVGNNYIEVLKGLSVGDEVIVPFDDLDFGKRVVTRK